MDNNLLSGLGAMGLGNLEGLQIYEEAEKKERKKDEDLKKEETVIREEDFLFDKSYECPVCDTKFTCKMVRAGRAKAKTPDRDLRPRYEHIDTLKYEIIACPECGYAGYGKGFQYLTASQKTAVRENICSSYRPKRVLHEPAIYTYEEALERYKLALVNAIVKHDKASEKAYICLKTGWLVRGMAENLSPDDEDYEAKKKEYENTENQFLRNAYDGMMTARSSEPFPICGMDQVTVDYLLANLAMRFEEYETVSRLISSMLSSKGTPSRIKDKVLDLKDELLQKKKEKNA